MESMEFGRFQLVPRDFNENDNCHMIYVENVNRDSDHWINVRNPKGENIGYIKFSNAFGKPNLFHITDIRQGDGPILDSSI